jgi:hypothetical protein
MDTYLRLYICFTLTITGVGHLEIGTCRIDVQYAAMIGGGGAMTAA